MCDVVRIGLKTVGEADLELPFFSVPLICEPLSHQPITFCKAKYDYLAPLNLADFHEGHTELKINMLIGSDHYWKIVTGEVLQGDSGPAAICTRLGWVLPTNPLSRSMHFCCECHFGTYTEDRFTRSIIAN